MIAIGGADSLDATVVAPMTARPASNVDIPAEVVCHIVLSSDG